MGMLTAALVSIQLFTFRPAAQDIAPGATATWTNQDDIEHTVTSGTAEAGDGRFQFRLAGKGASATVQFRERGVYPYFCERHPSMRGEICVH